MAQRATTSSGGRPTKRGAVLIALTAFLVGLAAGGVHRGSGGAADDRTTSQTAARSAAPEVAIDTAADRRSAPDGFARSEAGAVSAAAAFVTSGQMLLDVDPLAAEKAVRAMAAAETADAQVVETLAKLAAARDALREGTGRIRYAQAVLAWRLDSYSPTRARVAVWNVGVLSRTGIAPPQASWATSTFDLVWERGDWRLRSETIAAGPAPVLDNSGPPATSDELDDALDGFTDFRGAP